MNCPHCQKDLSENNGAAKCPFCGQNLPPETQVVGTLAKPLAPVRFHLPVFVLLLLLPPVATILSALLVSPQNKNYSLVIGFFGGGAAGIACGIMLGLRLGKTIRARIALCLVFAAIMAVVCIMLCFYGCTFAVLSSGRID